MRIRLLCCICCIGWMLSGCSGSDEIPDGVLPVNKLKPLVLEMMLLADYHKDRAVTDTAFDVLAANRAGFERILKNHKVSQATFQFSYTYYQQHPALLKVLTDSLGIAAQRMAEEVMAAPQEPKND